VPVNQIVEQAQPPRTEGDVTIIPVYEEVAVVERRLMLKEEIHIHRHRTTRKENLSIPLRTEEVEISRSDA
jgi:stress response protein YsnF